MGSIPVGGARLSTVIVCELVSVDCKDGVPRIHTRAIVKRGSFPSAIPNTHFQKSAFSFISQGGYPTCETLGEGEKLAGDGNFTPLLILFPKITFEHCNHRRHYDNGRKSSYRNDSKRRNT